MTTAMKLVVFDIDGCLSDDTTRRHLLPAKDGGIPHSDYDLYNGLMGMDFPIERAVRTAKRVVELYGSPDLKILFLTARPVAYRDVTEKWLYKHAISGMQAAGLFGFDVYMRPEGDLRTSPDLKINLLSEYIEAHTTFGREVDLIAAYDDRTDVLNAYRDKGITCYRLDIGGEVCHHSGASPFRFVPGGVTLAEIGNPALPAHNSVGSSLSDPASGPSELAEIADIFDQMSATLRSRAADYGYNASKVADAMAVFFPDGVTLKTAEDYEAWHLFELIIVKLTRFVNSGLRHQDSIHDMAIYAGFVERLVTKHNISINKQSV